MAKKQTYLIVDAGNTQVKLVYFQQNQIVNHFRFDSQDLDGIEKNLNEHPFDQSILSSVQSNNDTEKLQSLIQPNVILSKETLLPVDLSNYETVETLGADRIANAVAANHLSKTDNTLVVDIGTCIKYDLLISGKYQGGAIAPGLAMRFNALHDYTGNLPLVGFKENVPLIGTSTTKSILSGVINGMVAEMNDILTQYTQQFQPLTIFLTGGDAKRFDKALKNSIFAEENLTVKGLHLILQHNV